MGTVGDNYREVQRRAGLAAARAGRGPGSVRLVAVTKTVPAAGVREAVLAGASILGENRVQEALDKMSDPLLRELAPAPEWHLIGTLQKRKARLAVGNFALIHSVEDMELLREIDRQATKRGLVQKALLEVNVAGEATKHGFRPEDVLAAAKDAAHLSGVVIAGLMCVPPFTDDPESSRPYFRTMRELLGEIDRAGIPARELSMGMTQDYEAAAEEGATLIRVGTAIFGARDYK